MRNDKGESLLDVAFNENEVDVAYYLISRGCGSSEDKAKLFCEACEQNNLDVVKGLVEQLAVDPHGEVICSIRQPQNTLALKNALPDNFKSALFKTKDLVATYLKPSRYRWL